MQRTGTTGRILNTVFVLLLFCVFTITVVMALLSGVGAYRSIHENMEEQYIARTGPAYLEAKLQHFDYADGVQLEAFAQCEALALYETVDGKQYKTLIYAHEGYLRELFFEDGLALKPEDGAPVLPIQDVTFAWKNANLLQIVYTALDGVETEQLVYLHGGEEVMLHA